LLPNDHSDVAVGIGVAQAAAAGVFADLQFVGVETTVGTF
jgi:hypothetical protein